MKQYLLSIICGIGILSALLGLYFGSYLPLAKSQRYIEALGVMRSGSIASIQQFEDVFDKVFRFYSPIGDEEVAKFLSNDILSVISQKDQPEEVSRALVAYIEPYMIKDNVRHLLTLAELYRVMWLNYKNEEYYSRAENFYKSAYVLGPTLPPVLYSMLDLYLSRGDTKNVEKISEEILKIWDDPRVAALKG